LQYYENAGKRLLGYPKEHEEFKEEFAKMSLKNLLQFKGTIDGTLG